jgi:hypothetical protein
MFSTTSSFILFFCPQGTATYPFSQKGKRIKKEKPIPEAYNAVFGETVSTKIKEKRVKRQRGKNAEYARARFRPHTTRNVADPLFNTRGRPRFIA